MSEISKVIQVAAMSQQDLSQQRFEQDAQVQQFGTKRDTSSQWLISYDPANNSEVGRVEITQPDELEGRIHKAKQASKAWAQLTLKEREAYLKKGYDALVPLQSKLAELISREMGKDARRAGYEASGTVHSGEFLAQEVAQALQPQGINRKTQLQYRPLGVVAVISPWNYPLAMANNLLVPALMAGNSVILKPSEQTPLVADLFIRTLSQQLPDGVLQIAHGDGRVGAALVEGDINMVAFTGSLATGKKIMASAASGMKRLVMELGGNDPMIVLASADIQRAARFAVASSFENAGQMCTSTERVYVDERIADQFEQAVVQIAQGYRIGSWDEDNVNIGPMANTDQHDIVRRHIQDALEKGASLKLGDADPKPPFIKPTVITGMRPDMLLEREETFGPVVAIDRFSSLDEVIERANDSVYGLGATVFGGAGVQAVAERLQAGMIGINQGVGGGGDAPWVGAKQSGLGFHGSEAGHRQFAQTTVVSL